MNLKLLSAVSVLFAAGLAQAQSYPAKPIRVHVTCPAACLPDLLARAIGAQLQESWGQPVIIDNRAGANGNISMEACAKSAGDGYSICLPAGVIMSINPFAYEKLAYDPLELVPIILLGNLDQAIAVHASVPARNMKELVALARAKAGSITWASLGVGSTAHLYLEWMRVKTGVEMVHVPYKGSPQAMQAITVGEVQALALTPGVFAPQVAAGKLRVIAVVTGSKRLATMPDVPTLSEQGFDLDFCNWMSFYGPKGTPAEVVRKWNGDVNRLLANKAFTDKNFIPLSVTPAGGTPEDMAAVAKSSRAAGEELVRISKLKFE
ncbi:MAG: tripartite tricarboxylate transporter substrate binding protein [Betaproteobacteria bacterium]|nr:tripartite tricarboxylate transporter substrate binding protein [Betaproteobacteria bacterium]